MTRRILALLLLIPLASCGSGGTSVAGGGIGGTGISSGPVSGIGSFFVTGTAWNLDAAGEIIIDGEMSTAFTQQDDLERVGLVMTVEGDRSEDGLTGTAMRVVVDNRVLGPVSFGTLVALPAAPDTATSASFEFFGRNYQIDRSTVFDAATNFDDFIASADAQGWVVEISGLLSATSIRVTRVEVIDAAGATVGVTEVRLEGAVDNLQVSGDFDLLGTGVTIFDRGSGDPACVGATAFPDGPVSNTDGVEIRGVFLSETEVCADLVEEDAVLMDDDRFEIEALVTAIAANTPNASRFTLGGIAVETNGSTDFEPAALESQLRVGMELEVEGSLSGGVLTASEVKQRGSLRITALVDSVMGEDFVILGLPIDVTADTEVDPGPMVGLGFVEVEAVNNGAGGYSAIEVEEESAGNADRVKVRGRVDGLMGNVLSIAGIPITIDVVLTNCFDENEQVIDCASNFLSASIIGREVEARDADAPFDSFGVAEEIEFED
jgi:hypothetical protein